MDEEEIAEVIRQHFFSFKYRCECGEYLGLDPESVTKHLAKAIYTAMRGPVGTDE